MSTPTNTQRATMIGTIIGIAALPKMKVKIVPHLSVFVVPDMGGLLATRPHPA